MQDINKTKPFGLVFVYVRRACRTSEVKVLRGHPLPVNPKATPKPDYREVAGRGRDSEIEALWIETWYKALTADEVTKNTKVQEGSRNLLA